MARLVEISYQVPPEVAEAVAHTGRQEGRWIRAKCPYCDPEGRRRRNLAVGERGWKCHACPASSKEIREGKKIEIKINLNSAAADQNKKREMARRMFEQSSEIRSGDPVDRYLRETRKLRPLGDRWSTDLRRLKMWHRETRREYIGMLAGVRNPHGELVAVHRTYLMDDGTRADAPTTKRGWRVENAKLSLAELVDGVAIRVGYDDHADTIGVCEGIETALAFQMYLHLPCWSTLNTSCMTLLKVPREIRRVIIGPDLDKPNPRTGKMAGLDAAIVLRKRLIEESAADGIPRAVEWKAPPVGGDWADWAKHIASTTI